MLRIIGPSSPTGVVIPSEPFPDDTNRVYIHNRDYVVSKDNVGLAAIEAGYVTRTFHDTFSDLSNWSNKRAFNYTDTDLTGVETGSGLTFTTSADVDQYAIATAGISGGTWTGTAFGGGAYIEASIRHNPADTDSASKRVNGWPSFWAMSVEHLSPDGDEQWTGQAAGYDHFIEVDIFESINALYNGNTNNYSYVAHVRDWYGETGSYLTVDSEGSWFYPSNTNFTKYHRYGLLWSPATATASGYLEFFFDGKMCGSQRTEQTTHPLSWDQWEGTETPPPVEGSTAFGVIDTQHIVPILGTGSGIQMEVESVDIWQASAANNLTQ